MTARKSNLQRLRREYRPLQKVWSGRARQKGIWTELELRRYRAP